MGGIQSVTAAHVYESGRILAEERDEPQHVHASVQFIIRRQHSVAQCQQSGFHHPIAICQGIIVFILLNSLLTYGDVSYYYILKKWFVSALAVWSFPTLVANAR